MKIGLRWAIGKCIGVPGLSSSMPVLCIHPFFTRNLNGAKTGGTGSSVPLRITALPTSCLLTRGINLRWAQVGSVSRAMSRGGMGQG